MEKGRSYGSDRAGLDGPERSVGGGGIMLVRRARETVRCGDPLPSIRELSVLSCLAFLRFYAERPSRSR